MKKIAIIGEGYVGSSMRDFFKDHFNLVIVDKKYEGQSGKIVATEQHQRDMTAVTQTYASSYEAANGCDLVVVCLPTPCREEDGACDTSLVEEAVRSIDAPLFIIKSTVEPGTTDKLKKETSKRIVFSPEYCGESKYWTEYKFHTDVKETPWFVFGGDPKDTEKAVQYFIRVVGPTKKYHQTEALVAELTKYIENTFYALKVTFCYEINELCERMGVDYYKMREAWLLDPRINPMHTAVFEESERPFGGRCVPGDARIKINGFSGQCKDGIDPMGKIGPQETSIEEYYNFVKSRKDKNLPWANINLEIGNDTRIYSTSHDLRLLNEKKIIDVTCSDFDGELFVFETDAGEFRCTPEHLMPILRDGKIEIVQAQNIKESDELFCIKKGKHFPAEGETNDSKRISNKERDESMGSD